MRGDQEIVVVVRREGELLVMRRAPERLGYWSLVSGGLEPDETPQEAAQRELLEETGLRAEVRQAARSRSRTRCSTIRLRFALATRRASSASPSTRSSRTPTAGLGADSRRRARPLPLVRPRRGRRAHGVRDDSRRASSRCGGAVRVGVDTSPLVQTRAGTARVVRGLLGCAARPPRVRARAPLVRWPGSCLERRAGRPLVPGAARPDAPAGWTSSTARPFGARSAPARQCRRSSRCTTSRSCARRRRSPAGTASTAGRGSTRVLRAADAIVAVSEFTQVGSDRARGRAGRARPRRAERGRRRLHARRPARGRRLRARGRDARAAEEPRSRGRRRPGGRRRAARGRRSRVGRSRRRRLGRRGSRRRARGALPRCALRRVPVAVRGLRPSRARGDGVRDTRRDVARDRDGGGRGRRRSPRRSAGRLRDRGGHPTRRARGATSSFRPASPGRSEFTWQRAADAVVELWRELA